MLSRRISDVLVVLAIAASALSLSTASQAERATQNAAVGQADSHASGDNNKHKKSCADSASAPKALFQLSNAEDTALVLRVVANYLLAEPNAEVTVVGHNSGAEFMLSFVRT